LQKPKRVGIYKLSMKKKSDNFRDSAIIDIIKKLKIKNIDVQIYEPSYSGSTIFDYPVENDFLEFKKTSDVILANRYEDELDDVKEKVYSRDIFYRD